MCNDGTRAVHKSKERFAIPRYSLIIIQKLNIQVVAHTFAYFSIQSPLTLKHFTYHGTSLCIPYSYHLAAQSILQVFIICKTFTSKELHFWKQEIVRRCQVRNVRRMLEDVQMELLTQQGLCLPCSRRTCIVVQQYNSTRDLASQTR